MHFLFFACCVLINAHYLAADNSQLTESQKPTTSVKFPTPPQTFNLHVTTPQPTVHIENTNTNLNQISIQQQFREWAEYGKNTHHYAKGQLVDLGEFTKLYIQQNYGKLFLGSIAAIYAYLTLRLLYLHRSTSHQDSWAHWKKNENIDEIETMTQAQLSEKLVLAIQEKYQSAEKIADFISPFVAFVNDTNKEIKDLNSYIWLLDTLKRLRLIGLFPGYQKSIVHAREKLKRVMYLKNVFGAWMAEYKLHNSTLIQQQPAGRNKPKTENEKKTPTRRSFFERPTSTLHQLSLSIQSTKSNSAK